MKSRLKNLYKYLIENRKHEVKGWHDAYRNFYDQVGQIRERIKAGEGLSQSDEAFLTQLLYKKDNGIASRGQSVLSNENFQLFIKNKNFISELEQFILTPNKENFKKFDEAWSAQGKSNNPVLVNRVAATCTLEVSTTVDSGKFNQVFSWLIREGIIPTYPAEKDQDWFSKNIFLLKIIKDAFRDELRPHREKLSGAHWQYIFEISDSSKLVSDAVPPFFFIIDEVNRAELSRVFGELMYCLEYRGVKGNVKTQYAYLMNLKYATSLTVAEVRERVWDDCIRPLLQEYLRGTGKEAELIGSFGKAFGV